MGGSDNDIIFVSALGKIQARRNNFEFGWDKEFFEFTFNNEWFLESTQQRKKWECTQ